MLKCSNLQRPIFKQLRMFRPLKIESDLVRISKTTNCLATLGVLGELGALAKHPKIVRPSQATPICVTDYDGPTIGQVFSSKAKHNYNDLLDSDILL